MQFQELKSILRIELQLGQRHTDCLAKGKFGSDGEGCGPAEKSTTGKAVGCC